MADKTATCGEPSCPCDACGCPKGAGTCGKEGGQTHRHAWEVRKYKLCGKLSLSQR